MRDVMQPIDTTDQQFHDGDPLRAEPGTIVTAAWLNDVQSSIVSMQREMESVLSDQSISPQQSKQNQLITAIKRVIKNNAISKTGDTMSGELVFTGTNSSGHYINWHSVISTSLEHCAWFNDHGGVGIGLHGVNRKLYFIDDQNQRYTGHIDYTTGTINTIKYGNLESYFARISDLPAAATTSTSGIVQLSSAINSDSETRAATSKAVKQLSSAVVSKTGDSMSGELVFTGTNSSGHYSNWHSVISTSLEHCAWFNDHGGVGIGLHGVNRKLYFIDDQNQRYTGHIDYETGTINTIKYGNLESYFALKNELPSDATKTQKGIVKLSSSIDSSSETEAATSKAVKAAYDKAESAVSKSGDEMSGELVFTGTNSSGHYINWHSVISTSLEHCAWFNDHGGVGIGLHGVNRKLYFIDDQNQRYTGHIDYTTGTINTIKYGNLESYFLKQSDVVGSVVMFAMQSPPAGWLKCNGAAVSRTTYARLFAAIGTRFGSGNGSTTFNLPDLRGEFIRGWDDGRGIDQSRSIGSHQGDAIRNIQGSLKLATGANEFLFGEEELTISGAISLTGRGAQPNPTTGSGGLDSNSALGFDFNASRVVPTANENRPRNIALLACIKY